MRDSRAHAQAAAGEAAKDAQKQGAAFAAAVRSPPESCYEDVYALHCEAVMPPG